jgi:hypothetical protein
MHRTFLRVTAIAEGVTGLALVLAPNLPISILFGQPLLDALSGLIGRIAKEA